LSSLSFLIFFIGPIKQIQVKSTLGVSMKMMKIILMILSQNLTYSMAAENQFRQGFGPTYILQIQNEKDVQILQRLLKNKKIESTEISETSTDNEKIIPTPRWKISCGKSACEILIKQ
jgi:hypothetical protein